jgi:16S rRNA (cytosine967-C5)-methyltransferase
VTSAARQRAFDVLVSLDDHAGDLPSLMAGARKQLSDPRDQSLLTELVAGTVRMRAALDYQLSLRLRRPPSTLDPAVLTSLRLGAFQLIYLSRTPPSAVVNDAVAITKRAAVTSAAALVNAVLRRLARERTSLTWPAGDGADALAVRYSHPAWLVDRWLSRYGPDATKEWLAFNNQVPRLCLAVNRWKGTRDQLARRLAAEGVDTTPAARAVNGLIVERGAVFASASYREGWFVVQDEASQLIGGLGGSLATRSRVLDLCAAPGGKTLALSWRAGSSARVVACDVRPRRVRLLRATIARLGLGNVSIVQVGAAGSVPFRAGAFDVVLVDAPCSGLGTLRRDPDIRWRRAEGDLARFADAQVSLLERTADVVAPRGTLVYATCSSEPDENEQVVHRFLDRCRGFSLVQEHRTAPFRDALEAFYGAVMSRHL